MRRKKGGEIGRGALCVKTDLRGHFTPPLNATMRIVKSFLLGLGSFEVSTIVAYEPLYIG